MPVTIEFDDWFQLSGRDVRQPVPRFRVRDGSSPDFLAVFALPRTLEAVVSLRSPALSDEDLDRGILRYGARVTEQHVRDGVWPTPDRTEAHLQFIQENDLELVVELAREKECDYQISERGDLFCTAAAPGDGSAIAVAGRIRPIAPTSKPICRTCSLPDSDWRCSYLTHPEVQGTKTPEGGYSRDLLQAMCQLGRLEISDPGRCRAGGHRCWRREVRPELLDVTAPSPADAIALALDHLDANWRLAFGEPLVRLTSAESMAGVAQGCSSRAEFESRVSDIADVLKGLQIPDDLLGDEQPARHETLKRLRSALIRRAPDEEVPISNAIEYLSTINRVRVAMQHGGAAPELPSAMERAGIAYPVQDWHQAWDV